LPTTTDGALGETVMDDRATVVGGGVEGLAERPLLPPPHPVRAVSNITIAASANLVLVLMYNLPYFIPVWGSGSKLGPWFKESTCTLSREVHHTGNLQVTHIGEG
jgi:hypothetical protein